ESKLSWSFPSVDEAYARVSWKPGDLVVGVRKGELVVQAGGQAVLVESGLTTNNPAENKILGLTDDGGRAMIRSSAGVASSLELELDRKKERLLLRRTGFANWQFWCQGEPKRHGNQLK